ncbi:MAG: GAF domain-containing protein [Hoeflea sp.]|nr:GAF domain-containing protein [Hoeflea sp.]
MLDQIAPLQRFEAKVRTNNWTSLFPALDEMCQALIGHRLFSCSVFRMSGPESGSASRVYTSDPESYPLSSLKKIVPNRWTEQVIVRRETFVANSVEGFADVFPDHAFIASLGLGSVINLPVVFRGNFIGTVNMLHEAGYYTEARVEQAKLLAVPSLLAFEVSPEVSE